MQRFLGWWDVKDRVRRVWPEKLAIKVAWMAPRWLVKWCVVRAACMATSADETITPSEITYERMAKAVGG